MNETRDILADHKSLSLGTAVTVFEGASGARQGDFLSPDPRSRLQAWQARLASHFSDLAAARRETDWPVFALEHALNERERNMLMQDVRSGVGSGPSREVALPWIVYAVEIGYEYSGFEYWQTFESKTPGWQQQWRDRVRSRFSTFAANYHGAEPDGEWAHQFNIIAWPITHGILPRDLQRQLAELLYDASVTFRAETFASAEALGRHLQARCFGYSSRFRQFAENAALLGQIALALLMHDSADAPVGVAEAILHADTLRRITEDLNRERDARQWLADARSAARFRMSGLSRITLRSRTLGVAPNSEDVHDSADVAASLPRPRFILREIAVDQWQARVQLPNLANLAGQSPRAKDTLMRVQGRVAGAAVPILANGRIVRDATPTVTLAVWPAPRTQLLTFDGAPPELDSVLSASFRMGLGDRWLFVIGSDGQARELGTRVLRAGASYLLLQRTETRNPAGSLGLKAVQVACAGIFGLRIDVPEAVPEALSDAFAILGLEVAQTLVVWPAGLPIPEWSGDGHGEWVAGQPIILGIRANHRLARLTLTIDGVRQPDVDNAGQASTGASVFVQLPSLRPGQHRIAVAASTTDCESQGERTELENSPALAGLRGELSCVVREPRTAAAGQVGALSFAVLPRTPSLEDIWEDRIEIHVAAPGITTLRCRVVLRGLHERELYNRIFGLSSPSDTEVWRQHFGALRRATEDLYDEAQSCTITFEAGNLGRAAILAERDFHSLRWAIRENGGRADLVDLQGSGDLTVVTYRCSSPTVELAADPVSAQSGVAVEECGRLLVARRGRQSAAVVVVPRQNARDFSSLLLRPQVAVSKHSVGEIRGMIAIAQLWECARLGGSGLARPRQHECVRAILSSVFGGLGGRAWEAVEAQVRNGGNVVSILRAAELHVAPAKSDEDTKQMYVRRLAQLESMSDAVLEQSFVDAVRSLTKDDAAAQCARFSLILTVSPGAACDWASAHPLAPGGCGDEASQYLNYLCSSQFIARAARFVRLRRLAAVAGDL